MKKVYIIGCTKGSAAFQKFKAAELQLVSQGYLVQSLYRSITPGVVDDEVKHRMLILVECNTVFVLPDWSNNEYCLLELHTAIASNMQVMKANNTIIPERFTIYTK